MSSASKDKLLAVVKSMLASQTHSDLVITCHESVFNVHKNIVCTQSDFFAKAINFPVGEEAKDNKIDLPADDPDIVKLLVQFFYEAEYDPVGFAAPPPKQGLKYVAPQSEPHSCSGRNHVHKSCDQRDVCIHHICSNNCSMNCKDFWCQSCLDQPIGTAEQLLTHVKVYAIADKYNVDALKDMAAWKFQRACFKWWNDTNFTAAAQLAYAIVPENDRGLGDTIQKMISMHVELIDKSEIKELLNESNGLALRLLEEKLR